MKKNTNKQCSHPTCEGECRRIKKPKKRFILKRVPIKKFSKKQRKRLVERKSETELDWHFFLDIWEERDHVDFETGDPILGDPLTLYFHHVLKSRKYKQFRRCKWNIVLVSWETHTNADNTMKTTPRIKAYYEYLISHLDKINAGKYIPSFKKFENERR